MAIKNIPDLVPNNPLADTDLMIVAQGSAIARKVPLSALKSFMLAAGYTGIVMVGELQFTISEGRIVDVAGPATETP